MKNTATMMDLIDGDIAKHIWGFFLEFDDDNTIVSTPKLYSRSTGNQCSVNNKKDDLVSLDRQVDFQSIRSLRGVNKFFYRSFEEFCGWSRLAVAMKREYRSLMNEEKTFDNWSFVFRAQTLRVNHVPSTRGSNAAQNSNHTNNQWTLEQRRQVAKILSRAMERKKVSVYRCNQLIRMLDRGPFSKDEKLLTNKHHICVVH